MPQVDELVLLDAATQLIAEHLGVDASDWLNTPTDELARATELFEQHAGDALGLILDEPHALGWLHQHLGEARRDASNRAHTRDEAKHASGTTTTQLYTPRWIADALVERTLALAGDKPSVFDPAVGGGQMLLAAIDTQVARSVPLEHIVFNLGGCDIDARAADVARRSIKLHIARRAGARQPGLEHRVDQNIRCSDGLFDDIGSADAVITNPPYMGSRSMPPELKERIFETMRPFHRDLYSAFILRCTRIADQAVGILAQQTIWFLRRFQKARAHLLDETQLRDFIHLGPHAFATLDGEKANTVAFTLAIEAEPEAEVEFIDAREFSSPAAKREVVATSLRDAPRSEPLANFDILPGRVMAHWLPRSLRDHFRDAPRLEDIADIPGSQNKTGRNAEFVRKWHEVDASDIRFAEGIWPDGPTDDFRWVAYSKGGRFAPWWGNWEHVVDWTERGRAFYRDNRTSNLLDESWWFREGICYTDFAGSSFNARLMPKGCVFDMTGPAIFPHETDQPRCRLLALLAVLNSTPVRMLLNALNPSLHYQVSDVRALPVPEFGPELEAELATRAERLVEGYRRVAKFVDRSPLSRLESTADDREAARAFLARRAELEHELDGLVCELYGCPELLPDAGDRPVHHYEGRWEM